MRPRAKNDTPAPASQTIHEYPPCFEDAQQYEDWCYYAYVSDMGEDSYNSFCYDCTPEFQAKMLKRGLCLRPETEFLNVFEQDEEPQLHGLSPKDAKLFVRLGRAQYLNG